MSSYNVYTGPWINYSIDGVGRSQWTLTITQGGFLLAAVAVFVTIVGAQFWSIASFVAHQVHAATSPQDGMHHVRQVAYRNSSALGAAWTLFSAGVAYSGRRAWYWPKRVDPPYDDQRQSRRYLAVLYPLLIWAFFVAAAPLSSLITRQVYDGSEVLMLPQDCGITAWKNGTAEGLREYIRTISNAARSGLSYVNECYNSSGKLGCHTLPQQQLPYKVSETTTCPFGQRCLVSPLIMDTEWLDSHTHFGINAPKENRVQIRKEATCAVINVTDCIEYISEGSRYAFFLDPNYGVDNSSYLNYTGWVYKRADDDYTGYDIQSFTYREYAEYSPWVPIEDLTVAGADVNMFIISFSSLKYMTPTSDPLFKATTPFTIGGYKTYRPDNLAGVMICADRWQIKDPIQNISTTLTSYQKACSEYVDLFATDSPQSATSYRLLQYAMISDTFTSVAYLGASALKAQRFLSGPLSSGIDPEKQWQQEVIGWFETGLALLQQNTISYSSKNLDRSSGSTLYPFENPTINNLSVYLAPYESMCHNQKIRNVAQFQTFSVVGLATIFVVGLVIILISLAQETLAGLIPGMRWRCESWRNDSVLHLLRLAYRNNNDNREQQQQQRGGWEKIRHAVPVMKGKLELRGEEEVEEVGYLEVRVEERGKDGDLEGRGRGEEMGYYRRVGG